MYSAFTNDGPIDEDQLSVDSVSTNATADNLPGPGRLLGRTYGFLGARLERQAGRLAVRLRRPKRRADSETQAPLPLIRYSEAQAQTQAADDASVLSISTNATADNLPGPGRTLGLLYGFAGAAFESRAGTVAAALGFGPSATALRITKVDTHHAKFEDTPTLSLEQRKAIEKRCRRMLGYVHSNVAMTRRQALDRIAELTVKDPYVRELLNVLGAPEAVHQVYRDIALWTDSDTTLLTSSRKALICLGDTEVNNAVKDISNLSKDPLNQVNILGQYICDPDRSFLALRHIVRLVSTIGFLVTSELLKTLVSAMDESPDDLEWESVDRILTSLLSESYYKYISRSVSPWFLDVLRIDVWAKILRFADKLPRLLDSVTFKKFSNFDESPPNETEENIWHAHLTFFLLSSIYLAGGSQGDLFSPRPIVREMRVKYPHSGLRSLFRKLESEPDMLLCQFYMEISDPFAASSDKLLLALPDRRIDFFCEKMVEYAASEEKVVRERAQRGIQVLLSVNAYCRNTMLKALSHSRLVSTHYSKVVFSTSTLCMPRAFESVDCIFLYRHCDRNGRILHIVDYNVRRDRSCGCRQNRPDGKTYIMGLFVRDTLWLHVEPGASFTAKGHYPILAGITDRGERAYIALAPRRSASDPGPDADEPRYSYTCVRDGATAEDILVGCSHAERKATARLGFDVLVLRYDLEAYFQVPRYAVCRGVGTDATGPFYWTLAEKTGN